MLYYNSKFKGFQLVDEARGTAIEYCDCFRDSDHFLDNVEYTGEEYSSFKKDIDQGEICPKDRIPTEFIRGERQV